MSDVRTLSPQSHERGRDPLISLSEVLSQAPFITSLNQFLSEDTSERALQYWIEEFIPVNNRKTADDVIHAITRVIAEIDELIDTQINIIIHHARYQKLEASWRGLWYLVDEADGAQNIKIKFLDISWSEVTKDIGRALEFDQSQLFHKIYSEEYGTPGGEPYGVIIGDYEISHKTSPLHPNDDIVTLDGIAQICAAAFSPFITSASCEFFGLDNFDELGQPINLVNIFKQPEYIRWRALREKPDSRFIGITLPRILMRRPYSNLPVNFNGIRFHERSGANDSRNHLWANACYAFAAILLREFSNVGWFGHIRGVPRNYLTGGLVTNLPAVEFDINVPGDVYKPVTDVIITDAVEKDLSEFGFIPLSQCYLAPYAAFYNNQSIQQPGDVGSNVTRANARLSAMLQHVFCGSRIAHYIKIMVRDKIGSFISASECEEYLRNWLFDYTTGREDYDWKEQARYPLREADVSVKEHPNRQGDYIAVIRLKPHYQLDHMVSDLELVTELAPIG